VVRVRVVAHRSERLASHLPGRLAGLASSVVSTAIVVGLLAAVAIARLPATRTSVPAAAVSGGAPGGTPDELKLAAAALLELAAAPGGTGYRFEIVQRSTIHARPGGPKIDVPDPIDRHKSLGFADEYYLIGLTVTGSVVPSALRWRCGPGRRAPTPRSISGREILACARSWRSRRSAECVKTTRREPFSRMPIGGAMPIAGRGAGLEDATGVSPSIGFSPIVAAVGHVDN
jgi:hypothetical protein